MQPDDWRRNSKEHSAPNLAINLDFIEALRVIAGDYDKTRGAAGHRLGAATAGSDQRDCGRAFGVAD